MGRASSLSASTSAGPPPWMGFASIPVASSYETKKANAVLSGTAQYRGHLIAIPTKAEVEAQCQTVEVFIATVPARSANDISKC